MFEVWVRYQNKPCYVKYDTRKSRKFAEVTVKYLMSKENVFRAYVREVNNDTERTGNE